ncbi:LacI family DNA-binding transcriptional regulator [Schaalia sp. 19OD2882]|uniref:LacI family DNA-binding transcriptional regulator n=1 Tax=Schaalia sp. 19OD2882 TaxID=2794089 RepID=UPI001C1F1BF6|nr:LacI family DNA-binding transcriptional regulator [Schaalia sp. 19OD2882]QWW20337.1 LacI family DNA-binding transcriptional regulator [Schaalia sp. 19OD2882]
MKDIAREAEVALVTVSRALNGEPEVSAETREKVLAVARRLDYRPNRHARMLKLGSSRAIALMIKGVGNPFFQMMVDVIEQRARQSEHLLTVAKVPHWADEVDEAAKLVDEDLMAGIIFLGGRFAHEEDVFDRIRVPFVLSTVRHLEHVPEQAYSSVSVDDRLESGRAAEALVALGHRRIAVLGVMPGDQSIGAPRVQGCMQALARAGVPVDPTLVLAEDLDSSSPFSTPFSMEYGYRLTARLLRERHDVTAIFAVADIMALGAMRAIREAGLRVPEDISVMGFDGLPFGDYMHPPLSTMRQPAVDLASATCDLLLERMRGGAPRHVDLPAELLLRGTTGPVRDSTRKAAR